MSKVIDISSGSIIKTISHRTNIPKLKLVVSNPLPIQENFSSPKQENSNPGVEFTAEVFSRGPHLYEMKIQDPCHYLNCDLILEVEENQDRTSRKTGICHFPTIIDEQFTEFVEDDDDLYGILMIQFQMKVLEKLLLFCKDHRVSSLIIFVDSEQANALVVYHDFLTHKKKSPNSKSRLTEMVIPTDQKTFDDWISFMTETNCKFRQTLWHDQRSNPVIREYLISHPL